MVFSLVMPAHSRPKDGVASLAYVAGIHVFTASHQNRDVDGRDKPGHDEKGRVHLPQSLDKITFLTIG